MFNDKNRAFFSFTDILNYTQLGKHKEDKLSISLNLCIDELELRRTLVSLSCREYKLLKKYPEGDDIESTDKFAFNQKFSTEKTQLKMTTATLNEVIEKNSTMNTTVLFAREQQVDAVIVRIMKNKITITHGLLLSEVTRLVKFPVTVSLESSHILSIIKLFSFFRHKMLNCASRI